MNVALEAGAAVYVAVAVTLSVWIGLFVYLWRIDGQARALRRALQHEDRREEPAPTPVKVTRMRAGESAEK